MYYKEAKMYITYNKDNKRVMYLGSKKPISYSDNLILAEVDKVPEKYDYLTITNLQEKSRVVKEAYEEVNDKYDEETGELLSQETIKHEEVTENYLTCDLVANFRPQLTAEQLENQKEKRYEALCKKYIAEKIAIEDELKTIRRLLVSISPEVFTDTEARMNFVDYNLDVENCILKASEEVYK
jgi:hypothetical protein